MRIAKCLAAAIVPALLTTSLAFAQDEQAKSFLTEAIEGNLAEVQMGQLAQKLATTISVRAFGQMIEQDHGLGWDVLRWRRASRTWAAFS